MTVIQALRVLLVFVFVIGALAVLPFMLQSELATATMQTFKHYFQVSLFAGIAFLGVGLAWIAYGQEDTTKTVLDDESGGAK
jgi:hypothetical protein